MLHTASVRAHKFIRAEATASNSASPHVDQLLWVNSSQVKDPGQTYPRALAISIILVVLTYAAPTLIGIYYIPDKEEWEDGVFVEVGEEVGGAWLRDWMGFAGVVSSLAILCTMLCTTARMLEGMANTGNMPQMFANLHSKVRVAPPTLHAGSSSTLQWPPRTPYASVL